MDREIEQARLDRANLMAALMEYADDRKTADDDVATLERMGYVFVGGEWVSLQEAFTRADQDETSVLGHAFVGGRQVKTLACDRDNRRIEREWVALDPMTHVPGNCPL